MIPVVRVTVNPFHSALVDAWVDLPGGAFGVVFYTYGIPTHSCVIVGGYSYHVETHLWAPPLSAFTTDSQVTTTAVG